MELKFGERVSVSMSREERDVLVRGSLGKLTLAAKTPNLLTASDADIIGNIIGILAQYPRRTGFVIKEERLPLVAVCFEYASSSERLTGNERELATEAALYIRTEIAVREPELVIPDYVPDNLC